MRLLKGRRFFLALILGLHAGLGVAFGLATPMFEAPDEANHFLFVRYLQIHRALPVQTLDQDGPRAHHPPLYFLLAALLSGWAPNAGGAERVEPQQNANLWFRYGDQSNDHKTKYLHTPQERWPFRGQALAVHVIRLLSTVFSVLAVFFTYLAAQQLLPANEPVALLAAALLAFNPMVLFMSGVVQNSTSALASSAALLYTLSRWLRQGFTLRRWAWLGVLFSASILFQVSGLTLAVPVGMALAYAAWRARRFKRLLTGGIAFGLPVVLLTGWWFARNQILYGDWTANSIVGALWSDQPIMPLEQVWHLLITGMVGRFGFGLIVEYPDAVYWTVWALAIVAVVGLGLRLWRARRSRAASPLGGRQWPDDDAALWAMHVATVLVVAVALVLYMWWFIRGGHGRYLFTAYPSLALLLAAGGLAWFNPRWQGWMTALGASLNFALALYGFFGLLIPTYALPRSPTQAELARLTPLDADIGGAARVVGYRLSREVVKPGEALDVAVYWRPAAATPIPYTVFVHLYAPGIGTITQEDTYPGRGNYATTAWDLGRVFVDTYHLRLPEDAPSPSSAKILLGLYDAQTMQRLPVTGANAGPAEDAWVEFGNIQVQP